MVRARENPTVIACMIQGFFSFLLEQEIDPAFLFAPQLIQQIREAGTWDEFPELVLVQILERVASFTGKPAFGLEALLNSQERMFGNLTTALKTARSLEEAAHLLYRYNQLTGALGQFEIKDCRKRLDLRWEAADKATARPMTMQFRMGLVTANLRWLSKNPDMPIDVCLSHGEIGMKEPYEALFKGTVTFGQAQSRLVAPGRTMKGRAFPHWKQTSEPTVVDLTEIDTIDPAMLHRVLRKFITTQMASAKISIDEAAAYCSISSRTLQRWLDQTGIHYQELVDQVRMQTAKKLLEQREIRLARIAFMLGYTAQSNFQTAFRRWTGMSPGDYRDSVHKTG